MTGGRRTRILQKRTEEQNQFIREVIEAFAKVIDMKDPCTNGHSTRAAEYTVMLSREHGLDEETVERYYRIALLHDIGKVGIPPEVLNARLPDPQGHQHHAGAGGRCGGPPRTSGRQGLSQGGKGDEIPRVAQIIAVADTFDAMYSDRPYRKRMNFEKAVSIMKEVRGTQLTEDVDNIHRKQNAASSAGS
ncbi:MAG: HD domain-containing protein [Oscillospiraceae bacterium]|nr:HD domain-containing protein [Oscillospiraceae bacterium]